MGNTVKAVRSPIGSVIFSPAAALVLAALFWAGNFIVGRALKGSIPPVQLNFWRWVFALTILLPLSYKQLYHHRSLIAAEWKIITALGLTGVACFHICVYQALIHTTAINALIILSFSPMVIVLGSYFLLDEPIGFYQIIGISTSFIGAVILIAHGNLSILLEFDLNRGDTWMLVAMPLWAAYSMLLKRRPAQLPQTALLTSSVIAGVAIMIPMYAASRGLGQTLVLSIPNILSILYISIFASVLAFLCWNNGVIHMGPVKAGLYIHLMPFWGALLSFCFLGEGLKSFHIAGGIFVLAGIALINRSK